MKKEKPFLKDSFYLELALEEARKAFLRDEVPVGAVLVKEDQVFKAHGNEREATQDPLAHAEILCVQSASQYFKNWRLEKSSLYVTVEPCLLCSGAIYLSRIPKVVFGCKNPKGGALEFVQKHRKVLGLNHSVEIVSGVCEKECSQILTSFFQQRRKK